MLRSSVAKVKVTKRHLTPKLQRTEFGFTEAIMPPTGRKHHSSQLLVYHTPHHPSNWTLLLAWYTISPIQVFSIMVSRLHKDDKEWSEPVKAAAMAGFNLQNPVWMWGGNGVPLRLFFSATRRGAGMDTTDLYFVESTDGGETWGNMIAAEWMDGSRVEGTFVRNRPLPGAHLGQWIMPMYYTPQGLNHYESQYSELRMTQDDGHTWAPGVKLAPEGLGLVQPTVVRLESPRDGRPRMAAFFRNRFKDGIWRALSYDGGGTWEAPVKTDLPSNNKAIQAIVLRSGNLALVFNNNGDLSGKGNLYPMSIALSEDDGETWSFVRDLDDDYPKPQLDYTYPSVVQTEDGRLHVSHTWSRTRSREGIRYVSFDEAWIKKGYAWGSTRGVYRPPSESCIWMYLRGSNKGSHGGSSSIRNHETKEGGWQCMRPE